ncbi:MAG: hypothetical protein ABH879_04430 [archaeon]
MPVRLSVCTELFALLEGMDFYKVVDYAHNIGADIELAPFTEGVPVTMIGADERARRHDYLQEKEVRLAGIHWLLAGGDKIFGPEGYHIDGGPHLTAEPLKRRVTTADYVNEVLGYAADLRGRGNITADDPLVAVWGSPLQRSMEGGMSLEQAMYNAASVFNSIISDDDTGSTIALERLTKKQGADGETTFGYDLMQIAYLVGMTQGLLPLSKRGQMAAMMDVKATVGSGDDPIKTLRDTPCMVYHVHVQDPKSLGPPGYNGKGTFLGDDSYSITPLFKHLEAVAETGVPVTASIEAFQPFYDRNKQKPTETYATSIGLMRGMLNPELRNWAGHARETR